MRKKYVTKQSAASQKVSLKFCETFNHIVVRKNFESLSVQDFCEEAEYPRATFYNYFVDKYDFLDYYWGYLFDKYLRISDVGIIDQKKFLSTFFLRFYDMLQANEDYLKRILANNPVDGYLFQSLSIYMQKVTLNILMNYFSKEKHTITHSLAAEHVTKTIITVMQNKFINNKNWSRKQTFETFYILLYHNNVPEEIMSQYN